MNFSFSLKCIQLKLLLLTILISLCNIGLSSLKPLTSIKSENDDLLLDCETFSLNCSTCLKYEYCGWCTTDQLFGLSQEYLLNTGVGECMPRFSSTCLDRNLFTDQCPPCQCNGHSSCLKPESTTTSSTLVPILDECVKPCLDNTTGEFCESCLMGFFGEAQNGGNCTQCECRNQATQCDSQTGECFCNTKGVIGAQVN